MSIFVDSFVDTAATDLTAHTVSGGSGGPWTYHVDKAAGAVRIDAAATGIFTFTSPAAAQPSTLTPPAADYSFGAVLKCRSLQSSAVTMYLGVRVGTSTAQLDGYYGRWVSSATTDGAGSWQLWRFPTSGASGTQLGSSAKAAAYWSVGATHTVEVRAIGSSIALYVDGVVEVGPFTDTNVSRVGKPVIYGTAAGSSTAGYHYTSVFVDDLTPVVAPTNTTVPAVTGTAQTGQTLTSSSGVWANNPSSFAYQWKRNGSTNLGTGSTYVAVVADVGQSITCEVTATNTAGSSSPAVSNTVTPIALAAPTFTVTPVVSGYAQQGRVLSSTTGTAGPNVTGYTYQWTRDGANISGATTSTYTVVSGDVAHAVGCTVTATNATTTVTAQSNTVTPIAAPAREDPAPTDWTRTIVFFGDSHVCVPGVSLALQQQDARMAKLVAATNRIDGRTAYSQPAAYIQIGDQTEGGFNAEITKFKGYWNAIPGTRHLTIGNHDLDSAGETVTIAGWEAAYGVSEYRTADLGFLNVIFSHWSMNAQRQIDLEAAVAGSTKPVILCVHYPLRDTHDGGTSPHVNVDTFTPYTYCPSTGTDAFIKAMASRQPNMIGYFAGHSHCWWDSGNFAALKDVGSGVSIPAINVSATAYVGNSNGHMTSDPLMGFAVTLGPDNKTLEVRIRDMGAGVWRTWPTGEHSKLLARVG